LALRPVKLVTIVSANDEHHQSGQHRYPRHGDENDQKNRNNQGGGGKGAHFWKDIHEALVGILIFLVSVHVCGVIASSYVHKENLVLAMAAGKKKIR
jgi:cytochrome b